MARLDYGYVRSWDDPKYLQQLYDNGYAGALFAMDDPRLPQLVQQAQQMGLQYGIWGAPNQTPDGSTLSPKAFAERMAALQRQYNAQTVSLDLEFPYKGYQGSPGWNANTELAGYWKQMAAPGTNTLIAPMGSEWAGNNGQAGDFNYGAWQGIANGWNPQAYGAMLTDHQDPRAVMQALINAGIPADQISPLLAPGQDFGGGALYGLNEFGDLPKAQAPATRTQASGGSAAPTTSTTPHRTSGGGSGLSQSAAMIANSGLRWGGQSFNNRSDFSKFLQSRGSSYANWAAKHAPAAAALNARSPAPKGAS